VEFLRRFNRDRQVTATAPAQLNCDHTCLTTEEVRRICQEEIYATVDRWSLRPKEKRPARVGPRLTLAEVRKMSRQEIMERWDDVEQALIRGR
jgi:hypothetical protein